jgi:UDP-N-acetylmuramoyl-tripeptide--D-alanyl-D-alanine ligase
MYFWTPQTFSSVTGGRWLVPPADAGAPLAGLTTDSRGVKRGQAFLALKGEKFDGHDFLAQAGARAGLLIVADPVKAAGAPPGAACLLVPDTLAALQALARAYREVLGQAGTRVIAVAGSNGKTTTRSLIHAALSAGFRGTQSPKSFNNHIGVPLTLLAASREGQGADDFVAVEIGTNHPGEIEALGRLVGPDAAVLTSLGHEHMAFFGSLGAVAREESTILRHLRPGGAGLAVIEAQALGQLRALGLVPPVSELPRLVSFGAGQGDLRLEGVPVLDGSGGQTFSVRGGPKIHLPLVGVHNAVNALAAVAVGRWMGLDDAGIARGLEQVQPVEMRLNLLRLGTAAEPVVVLNDAYNANPDSVAAALATLRQMAPPLPGGRRVVILGDMLELGADGPELHRAVGRAVAAVGPEERDGFHLAVFVGKLAMFMAEAAARRWPPERLGAFPQWTPDLPQRVAELLRPGDLVLLKASRGVGLERLLPALRGRFPAAPAGP